MSFRNKKIVFFGFGFLFCLNVLAWAVVFDLNSQSLEVVFFDVGQGDAIFIETGQKHQILIDGGPSSAVLEKLGKEMPFWDRAIDLIILTHPDHDHIAGLIEVLKRYKVEQVLWTGVVRETGEYKEWQGLLEQEGAKITIAQAGQKIIFTGGGIEVLHPFESLQGEKVKNANNTSVVARLVFGQNSFLLIGDISKSVERKLVKKQINLVSDILKVGHHGSKTSSAENFLKKVNPEIAIIQCGRDNRYGHPHPEVLATLEKFGIKILRTDLNGDIKIISDGNNLCILKKKKH
ncbi:MBL fold metallo-hydrolase [Candidatus Parcubacteria bacterium]|nr:MBL fold metallo-hydrolase [Candidatus Parcubacteria bacterium]